MRALLLALALAVAAGLAAAPAAAQVPAGCEAALTNPCLLTLLQQMGLTPKPLTKGYLVVFKQGTWTLNIQVVLSPDGRKIGFNSNLGLVTEPAVSGAQWEALLIANADIDPSSFYYNPAQAKLFLHRSIDNRAMTAEILRTELDSFQRNLISTDALTRFAH